MKRTGLSCFCVAALLVAGVAQADPIKLSDLLQPGATIISGDKIFSKFTYVTIGHDMPEAGAINVIPAIIAGDYGLEFHGAFRDLPGDDNASDALITFTVSIDPNYPGAWISDARLNANISATETGAYGNITESFINNTPPITDVISVTQDNTLDVIVFSSLYKTLNVQKDIFLLASPTGNDAVVCSVIYQTFSQVPEPASLALLGLGAAGLAAVRRRRA